MIERTKENMENPITTFENEELGVHVWDNLKR